MAQGGLHWGVAVCKGAPGLPVTQPAPGLASVFSAPHPITPRVSAQVHHGVGTACEDSGPLGSSAARPGLGVGGEQRRGRGKGQNLPLRCSLRRGAGTYPQLRQSGSP